MKDGSAQSPWASACPCCVGRRGTFCTGRRGAWETLVLLEKWGGRGISAGQTSSSAAPGCLLAGGGLVHGTQSTRPGGWVTCPLLSSAGAGTWLPTGVPGMALEGPLPLWGHSWLYSCVFLKVTLSRIQDEPLSLPREDAPDAPKRQEPQATLGSTSAPGPRGSAGMWGACRVAH